MNEQTESEFLASYSPKDFDSPIISIDAVIFTVFDDCLQVLVVKRDSHPCKGQWALVGGFVDVHQDPDLLATARRKLAEKTGVLTPYLEQYACIGNTARDPRGWSISSVYFALIAHDDIELTAGNGAEEVQWLPIIGGHIEQSLAFDHQEILEGCLERLRNKVLYTSLPVHLMPEKFTLRGLQKVYEIILDRAVEAKSFRRRLLSDDILAEIGEEPQQRGRPAMMYTQQKKEIHYFLRSLEGDRKNSSDCSFTKV